MPPYSELRIELLPLLRGSYGRRGRDMNKYDQMIKDLRDPHCGDGTTTHIDMRREAADAIEYFLAREKGYQNTF